MRKAHLAFEVRLTGFDIAVNESLGNPDFSSG